MILHLTELLDLDIFATEEVIAYLNKLPATEVLNRRSGPVGVTRARVGSRCARLKVRVKATAEAVVLGAGLPGPPRPIWVRGIEGSGPLMPR